MWCIICVAPCTLATLEPLVTVALYAGAFIQILKSTIFTDYEKNYLLLRPLH